MPFVKGGKPGPGKPKGAKHKKTLEWDALGNYVCEGGVTRYMKLLKNLPDDEYMTRYERVLEYFKPRYARVGFVDEKLLEETSKEKKDEIRKALEHI